MKIALSQRTIVVIAWIIAALLLAPYLGWHSSFLTIPEDREQRKGTTRERDSHRRQDLPVVHNLRSDDAEPHGLEKDTKATLDILLNDFSARVKEGDPQDGHSSGSTSGRSDSSELIVPPPSTPGAVTIGEVPAPSVNTGNSAESGTLAPGREASPAAGGSRGAKQLRDIEDLLR